MRTLMYLNAYRVTRHYGGPEEGGWWYDAGEVLASVPVAAEFIVPETCKCGSTTTLPSRAACYQSKHASKDGCQFYDVADGECAEPCEWCPCVCHDRAVNTDPVTVEAKREELRALLTEEFGKGRSRFSVAGGVSFEVWLEDHVAEPFPNERPRYE